MPRRKNNRTNEDEVQFQRLRRERNTENQRIRRSRENILNTAGCSHVVAESDVEIVNPGGIFKYDGTAINVLDNNPGTIGKTGKTFLYVTLWYILKGKNINVTTMAFTGIAAVLLPKGRTVHKIFGLPVPLFSDSSSNIKLQSIEASHLVETDVFIWDEAPMAPRYALEVMDRTLRDVMNNNLPFGGKIVILGGDFRQLLPIKMHSTRSETINLEDFDRFR